MIDRTEDFKRSVKALKKGDRLLNGDSLQTSKVLRHRKQKSDFEKGAKDIVSSISRLRQFLLQHRNSYVSSSLVMGSTSDPMTDRDRDKIDEEAQNIIKRCNEAIATMRQKFTDDTSQHEQVIMHKQYVLAILQNHLKLVCKIYSEQRAIRVKSVVDKKRISRLHNPETHKKSSLQFEPGRQSSNKDSTEHNRHVPQTSYYNDSDDELSESEAAALEQENQLLFNDINSLVDEVKAIEGKVVEITRLQEVFSEQILKQEGDIDMISEKIVEGTENIKDGNEALREAIKNNAGFRVWILFFLVMCSFSLLFLEWYS